MNAQNIRPGPGGALLEMPLEVLSFDDFDACAAALRPWDLEAVQLDRGPFRGELIQAQSPTTLVIAATFGRKLHQTGEPPRGLRTVGIPARPGQQFCWRNQVVSGDQVVLFPRGSGLDVVSSPGFHIFSVSFPEDALSDLACALDGHDYEELLNGREIVDCSPHQMKSLRRAVGRIVGSSAGLEAVPLVAESAGHDVGSDLIESLVEALTLHEHPRPASSHRVRDLAVDRSLDLIHQHRRESLSVVALCRAARVSRRTLEYAFQERFGISPKAYMIVRRLNGVREELKRAGGDRSVTRSAYRWGFQHMSQFAALYKRQFGELPSETMWAGDPSR
jgi:AraC family ethanolamine operon transcriptional activator